ncbi:hypothetical protein CIW48_05020 [Methylobacterium sp. P1-11]|nr:hypothetical protein CIW48_05020 [Methylobacterium sp. P1-11]
MRLRHECGLAERRETGAESRPEWPAGPADRTGGSAGPLSRAGEGQGEGRGLSGEFSSLTPTLSRTGEGAGCVPKSGARARTRAPPSSGR